MTFHMFVLVSEFLGFAKADVVDYGSVIELLRDGGVIRA